MTAGLLHLKLYSNFYGHNKLFNFLKCISNGLTNLDLIEEVWSSPFRQGTPPRGWCVGYKILNELELKNKNNNTNMRLVKNSSARVH